MSVVEIPDKEVDLAHERLKAEARTSGYYLHPDAGFAKELIRGILINEQRYGYGACPCRLAAGEEEADHDIQCPCDYRDADLSEFGQCYCGLYVAEEISDHPEKCTGCIPERRGNSTVMDRKTPKQGEAPELTYPVWRCRVCGYLCARNEAPLICPICKAKRERFERFL